MAQHNKTCKICGELGHSKFYCKKKPRKPISKSTKPIKPGKHHNKWLAFRRKYLAEHQPNHQGYYTCYLCLGPVHVDEVTLDHVIPRSAAPHLRYDENNIRPACGSCNSTKGSKKL